MILPDLNDLLKEGLCVDELAALLEQLSHVEVALAEVDALGSMLHALLVDATSQLLQSLFVAVWSVLRHKETAKCDVQLSIVAIKLLFSDE